MGELTKTGIEESVPRQLQANGDHISLHDIGELLTKVRIGDYTQAIDVVKTEQPDLAYAFFATPKTHLINIWTTNRDIFKNEQLLGIWSSAYKFERVGQTYWPKIDTGLDFAGHVVMRSLITALSEVDSGILDNDALVSRLGKKAVFLVDHNVAGAKLYGDQIVAVASSQHDNDATLVENIVMKAIRIAQERELENPPVLRLFESELTQL